MVHAILQFALVIVAGLIIGQALGVGMRGTRGL